MTTWSSDRWASRRSRLPPPLQERSPESARVLSHHPASAIIQLLFAHLDAERPTPFPGRKIRLRESGGNRDA
jgi:hypothetical protein